MGQPEIISLFVISETTVLLTVVFILRFIITPGCQIIEQFQQKHANIQRFGLCRSSHQTQQHEQHATYKQDMIEIGSFIIHQ